MSKKTFIINDGSVANSYGFSVNTSGIALDRFLKNPVVLNQHQTDTGSVLGRWENVRVENGLLLGEPVFDTEDLAGKEVVRKVEKGIIKACSLGASMRREDLVMVDDKLVLTTCTLMEVSIVAVPANANAIVLYDESTNIALSDDDIKKICLSIANITNEKPNQQPSQSSMPTEKTTIKLTVPASTALGLSTNEVDELTLSAQIVKLAEAKATAEAELRTIYQRQEQAKMDAVTLAIEEAVKQGKVSGEVKLTLLELGKTNPEQVQKILTSLSPKASIAGSVNKPNGGQVVATVDDFMKLSYEEKMAFKNEQPEQYKTLFPIQ